MGSCCSDEKLKEENEKLKEEIKENRKILERIERTQYDLKNHLNTKLGRAY
jgi:predicted RNase H-like nuclease (RuvC/YqgF family)